MLHALQDSNPRAFGVREFKSNQSDDTKKEAPKGTSLFCMAERVGFEPTEGRPSPVFKTGAFDQLSHLSG